MNKLIDDIVKLSDLEKTTPNTEIFYKYYKDKDIMYDNLKSIFNKLNTITYMFSHFLIFKIFIPRFNLKICR